MNDVNRHQQRSQRVRYEPVRAAAAEAAIDDDPYVPGEHRGGDDAMTAPGSAERGGVLVVNDRGVGGGDKLQQQQESLHHQQQQLIMQPLEIVDHSGVDDEAHDYYTGGSPFPETSRGRVSVSSPLLLSSILTLFAVVPILGHCTYIFYNWTGRFWAVLPFVVHLVLSLLSAHLEVFKVPRVGRYSRSSKTGEDQKKEEECHNDSDRPISGNDNETSTSSRTARDSNVSVRRSCYRCPSSLCWRRCCYCCYYGVPPFCCYWQPLTMVASSLVDVALFGFVYRLVFDTLAENLLSEPDGMPVLEWSNDRRALRTYSILALFVVAGRVGIGCASILPKFVERRVTINHIHRRLEASAGGMRATRFSEIVYFFRWWTVKFLQLLLVLCWIVVLPLLLVCFLSVVAAFLPSSMLHVPNQIYDGDCSAMDTTECWLPFPSFHHARRDISTPTGWRVDLQGQRLPPMKSPLLGFVHPSKIDPGFLNDLDGFSTMGPILFYIDGLKEAHEAGVGQLHGHDIAVSLTPRSRTLLLNVNKSTLVAHSTEIDYLDPANPLAMVFPAQPLAHNQHYALAVLNATDSNGRSLPPTLGTTMLMSMATKDSGSDSPARSDEDERLERFTDSVLPALFTAAPWLEFQNNDESLLFPDGLQLLFDFVTISEVSQLGPVRAVRDLTLEHVSSQSWGDWTRHVRTNKVVDSDCESGALVARTVHAELDVPWFLSAYGPGHRGAFLDGLAVQTGQPTTIGSARFVVHIPCSVRAAAIAGPDGMGADPGSIKPIRAIMEFGHGLFGTRGESSDDFLQQMSHDEGYIIMAMDWRGMSLFDILVVIKTLLSEPSLFQSVRDNLYQGFANKFALLHFSRNGMLSMDWFQFTNAAGEIRTAPILNDEDPASIFYGISQGGILGAGYASLAGATGLIDRAILGSPGTPFALIMTRSLDFQGYDALLLLNFYDNRHVRTFLALAQMAWDSAEGSGVLATPVSEPIPPMLIQAGLGDPVVPSIAAEALARALGASVLPNHPRDIWGVKEAPAATETQNGPYTTLTELLYEEEYASLPVNDEFAKEGNSVHICLRRDRALIRQICEFVNTARVIDPCVDDGCRRAESDC